MVRFEENKLVIEIETRFPTETWLNMHRGICDVVRTIQQEDIIDESFHNVIDLLAEIMPEEADARKLKADNPAENQKALKRAV